MPSGQTSTTANTAASTPALTLSTSHSSPNVGGADSPMLTIHGEKKKKKKKKSKAKSVGARSSGENAATTARKAADTSFNWRDSTPSNGFAHHNALRIARNKHWKYISSYHGPWLQLPLELLQSLLLLNMDPSTAAGDFELTTTPPYAPSPSYARANTNATKAKAISAPSSPRELAFGHDLGRNVGFERLREMNAPSLGYNNRHGGGYTLQDRFRSGQGMGTGSAPPPSSSSSTMTTTSQYSSSTSMTTPSVAGSSITPMTVDLPPGKAAPPPIDPGVFASVVAIRRLVDESADLAVRASSGLSAAALGALQSGSSSGGGWGSNSNALGGSAGFGATGDIGAGGRNVPMSATRVHRLRAMAVQRLADAYRADEVAASVMVMQRGTVFDEIAEKVLKGDPSNVDARYVQFFHEKIPSRQLAESTTTAALDQLIAENPQQLYLYRTRGIVHGFREEYALAIRDYTLIVKESRAQRRAKEAHMSALQSNGGNTHTKGKRKKKVNGQAPPSGTSTAASLHDDSRASPGRLTLHHSVLPNAPDPLEMQALFYRGSTYLAQAYAHIERVICAIEDIPRISSNEFGEIELAHIAGRYGGTELGNPLGPLGASGGVKSAAYRAALAEPRGREQVETMLRKARRDHERFLAHFDSLNVVSAEGNEVDEGPEERSVLERMENSYLLIETLRPSARQHEPPPSTTSSNFSSYSNGPAGPTTELFPDVPLPFTTYHPLMLESFFSMLNCILLLGDFEALVPAFERAARIVAGLEGYPVFLPPRSMAQAEFVEVLERLANGWKYGRMESALVPSRKVNSPRISAREKEKSRAVENVATSFADLSFERNTYSPPLPPTPPSRPKHMVNGSMSSFAGPSSSVAQGSASGSGSATPVTEMYADDEASRTPNPEAHSEPLRDRRSALEHLRYLLTPIHARLASSHVSTPLSDPPTSSSASSIPSGARNGSSRSDGARKPPLNLVLHGARVEVILAWVAAVHLPELEGAAESI